MKNFLRQRQQLSSAVSAEYRRVWWSFKIPTANQKQCQFSTRTVIGRRVTHLREYSSRFRGPALSLYRHMDPYPSLGHASVTHLNMMGQCTQVGRDQRRVLCYLIQSNRNNFRRMTTVSRMKWWNEDHLCEHKSGWCQAFRFRDSLDTHKQMGKISAVIGRTRREKTEWSFNLK